MHLPRTIRASLGGPQTKPMADTQFEGRAGLSRTLFRGPYERYPKRAKQQR